MSAVLPWLFGATLSGSAAILLSLALVPMIRKTLGARAAHGVWIFTLVLLLSPWHPRSPVGVLPPAAELPAVVVQVIAPAGTGPEAVAPALPQSTPIPWLLLAWGTGTAGLLGLALVRALRAGRLVRRSKDITLTVQSALGTLRGLPCHARVCESPDLLSPAVCGLWRPVILLPPGWAAGADVTELRCVLLHEIGHIRRGDLFWRWAFQIAQAVHWFNPLVWLAERMAQVDQEMACDEWVLAQGRGMDRETYGEVLLRMAHRVGVSRFSSPEQAGMAESRLGLSRRIHHLVKTRPRSLWASLVALGLGVLIFLMLSPRKGVPSASVPPPATQIETNSAPAASAPSPEAWVEIESKFLEVSPEAADKELRERFLNGQAILEPPELQGLLQGLSKIKNLDMLSAPKVTTKSGSKAIIRVVQEFPYPTEFQEPDANSGGLATPRDFETRNVGVTLEVEPTATPDGRILCSLNPEIVEFLGFINYGASHPDRSSKKEDAMDEALSPGTQTGQTINQPVFQTRKMQTTVSLQSGQTVLFGGLSRKDKQVVEDMINGKREQSEQEIEKVLYILVTARLVDAVTMARRAETPAASPASAHTPPPAQTSKFDTPYGTPVPNKPGFITSPYAPYNGQVDVRGFPPGTKVKCPYTANVFLVP